MAIGRNIINIALIYAAATLKSAYSGLECDFESSCGWTFDPPYNPPHERGFRVVSGKEYTGKSGKIS